MVAETRSGPKAVSDSFSAPRRALQPHAGSWLGALGSAPRISSFQGINLYSDYLQQGLYGSQSGLWVFFFFVSFGEFELI